LDLTVIIGYELTQNENYNQYDVMKAIRNSIMPHENINFIKHPSFNYDQSGGFPSDYIPATRWAVFDTIMLDNAKSQLATNVVEKLSNVLKCTVNFGSVATPETRGIIERFFGTLEKSGIHRLPGTTGSSLKDKRRKNPENEAIKCKTTYEDLKEIIEYFIAKYNNSAHSALDNQTPLENMKSKIENAGMFPYVTKDTKAVMKLTNITIPKILRGNFSAGVKPYISYKNVRYHAFETPVDMSMIGQKVILDIDSDNIGMIDIYDTSGNKLSTFIAQGSWGRSPHSIKTLDYANKMRNSNKETNEKFSPDVDQLQKATVEEASKSKRARTRLDISKNESKNPKALEKMKSIEKQLLPNNRKLQ
jgi:putative transposase